MKLKSILSIALFLFLIKNSISQRFDVILNVDGTIREFIIVKPTTPPPNGGYPLVFMLHGTSGDGEKFYNISGWKEVGQKENLITVFPSSLRYCVYQPDSSKIQITKWNNGDLQSFACPNQNFKDDVKFFRRMVDTILAALPVNKSMIYVAGFSNGGAMAAKLALEMPEIFAAATATGAFLHDLDSMRVKNKIPVWNMFGTHDSMFIERSGKPYIPFNDTCLAYLRNGIHNYLGSFGLDSSYVKTNDSLTLNYTYSKTLPNEGAAYFRHTLVNGMTHQYPNGINFLPMKAAPLHWEFFKSYKKTTSVQSVSESNSVQIWPNPFRQSFTISDYQDVKEFTINDLWGNSYAINATGNIINLGELPPQIYLLTIKFKNNKIQKIKCLKLE